MKVKRKLYSVVDEDGNLGYYLYDESNGEEKLFSVVEEEREFARGIGKAVKEAVKRGSTKGNKIANKAAKREYYKSRGLDQYTINNKRLFNDNDVRPGSIMDGAMVSKGRRSFDPANRITGIDVNRCISHKIPGNIEFNKYVIKLNRI